MANATHVRFEQGEKSALCATAATYLLEAIQQSAVENEKVVVGLCGGTSPDHLYAPLCSVLTKISEEVRHSLLFLNTDERRVPLHHAESNWRRLHEGLFVPAVGAGLLRVENFLPFPAMHQDPEEACRVHEHAFAKFGGRYHIVVLAAGGDGHTAAAWGAHASATTAHAGFIYEPERPKPPAEGFTASLSLLKKSDYCVMLFFGEGKKADFHNYCKNPLDPTKLPVQIAKQIPRRLVVTDLELDEDMSSSV